MQCGGGEILRLDTVNVCGQLFLSVCAGMWRTRAASALAHHAPPALDCEGISVTRSLASRPACCAVSPVLG